MARFVFHYAQFRVNLRRNNFPGKRFHSIRGRLGLEKNLVKQPDAFLRQPGLGCLQVANFGLTTHGSITKIKKFVNNPTGLQSTTL